MPVERFYLGKTLEKGKSLVLEEEEFHHLAHVIRKKPGDSVEIVNGAGSLAVCEITEVGKRHATLTASSVTSHSPPPFELILAQAIPSKSRLDFILEKTVELGVTEIRLFEGMQSEKKISRATLEARARSLIISALKQSGRLFLPNLLFCPRIALWQPSSLPLSSFFGDVRRQAPPFVDVLSTEKTRARLIAIGPEKGFHPEEVLVMEEKLRMKGVSLHQNILKADTAAMCGIALASAFV
jgi:16S rRNA (uracil1498-N3)-methyltransferase